MNSAHQKLFSGWCRIGIAALTLLGLTLFFESDLNSSSAWGQTLGPARIQLIDGSELDASIESIRPDGSLSGNGIPAGLNLLDILSIQTERKLTPDSKPKAIIIPVGGGQLAASLPQIGNDKLTFKTPSVSRQLPLQAIRAVVWRSSPSVKSSILNPSKENDRVIVETAEGERSVDGLIESVDTKSVHINYKGKSRTIGIEKVKAIVMADLDLPAPSGSPATLHTVDGSVWIGVITGLLNGDLSLKLVGDGAPTLNVSEIIGLTIASDRLVFLSDLDPLDVQERPLFSIKRPFRRDQSVGGNPMTIRLANAVQTNSEQTESYAKGLGTQSFSQLMFANTRGYNRLKTTVGIDAETNGRGDCKMSIWGDGIELWSKRIRATDGPHSVDVDISGLQEITLIVDPGEKFDLGDHANWGNVRFLKTN